MLIAVCGKKDQCEKYYDFLKNNIDNGIFFTKYKSAMDVNDDLCKENLVFSCNHGDIEIIHSIKEKHKKYGIKIISVDLYKQMIDLYVIYRLFLNDRELHILSLEEKLGKRLRYAKPFRE